MRTILAAAITATFVLVTWWSRATFADAGANVTKSMDSTVVTSNVPDMPQYVGP